MSMTNFITLAVPVTLTSIAQQIAVAFETDGGIDPENYPAFSTICADAQSNQYAVYGTPCHAELDANVDIWKTNPQALLDAVTAALAARWPWITPPTLEDVTAFCAAVQISHVYNISAGIEDLSLTLVTQNPPI